MDDSVSGAQIEDELFNFYLCVKILLNQGGFNLRKWITNSFDIVNKIDEYENKIFWGIPFREKENL